MFFPFFSILLRSPPSKRNWSGVEREGSTAERARERGEGGKGKERARGVFSSSHFSGNLTSSPFPLFSSSSSSLVSPHLWPGRSLIVSEQLSATISVISQGGARGGFSGRVFLYVLFFFLSFQPAIPRSLIFFFSLSATLDIDIYTYIHIATHIYYMYRRGERRDRWIGEELARRSE